MHIVRRTHVTLETRRIVVIHRNQCNTPLACPECGGVLLNWEQATLVRRVTAGTLARWITEGILHSVHTPTPFLCLTSLLQAVESGGTQE
jgi:hypothetical protein